MHVEQELAVIEEVSKYSPRRHRRKLTKLILYIYTRKYSKKKIKLYNVWKTLQIFNGLNGMMSATI